MLYFYTYMYTHKYTITYIHLQLQKIHSVTSIYVHAIKIKESRII
jgi:hypothetical protein